MEIKFCELCNTEKKELYIHHKNKNTGDDSIKNILIVCSKCHKSLHKKEVRKTKIMPLRVTPEQKESILIYSKKEGLDSSVWIRKIIMEKLNGSGKDR